MLNFIFNEKSLLRSKSNIFDVISSLSDNSFNSSSNFSLFKSSISFSLSSSFFIMRKLIGKSELNFSNDFFLLHLNSHF
jgi:hypothetical protein